MGLSWGDISILFGIWNVRFVGPFFKLVLLCEIVTTAVVFIGEL